LTLVMALFAITWGVDRTFSEEAEKPKPQKLQKITPADRKAAAKRAAKLGLRPGVAGRDVQARKRGVAGRDTQAGRQGAAATRTAGPGMTSAALPLPGIEGPGGIPHYFGPYGNWAYSPLPMGPVASVTLVDQGTAYANPLVFVDDAYGTATAQANVTAAYDPISGAMTFTIVDGGAGYSAPVVTIEDDPALCGVVPLQPVCGTGATADAVIGGTLTGGMLKFVDALPGLGPAGANSLGQYIPVAVPEIVTFSGQQAEYYEIALVEFTEQMHSNLPPTRLRGYVQLATANVPGATPLVQVDGVTPVLKPDGTPAVGVDKPHSLGPVIVAKGRVHGVTGGPGDPVPVRVKFYNLLPAGAAGDLFLPVDETVPGSGLIPAPPGTGFEKFTHNRATVHLHGNNTVWISDGNTHQWITPADEVTPYPKGVSARNVPDMLDVNGNVECDPTPALPNSGCQTFFYTNAQSARLQFYHDHALGITRLNVYAGEAAGYVLTDAVDQDMINGTNVSGVNPGLLKVLPDIGIPLVIQDKTWVDADTIFAQDPTWNWGTGGVDVDGNKTAVTGDLWYPHVYMSAQNPWDLSGTNAFGRWHYGPWFNPPVPECVGGGPVGCIDVGPVPNEYYDPANAPWEPPMRPGVPNPSIPGEGFMDTPTVNGTAYPYMVVEPRAYRFRILSAANDRMFNLQLYVAHDKTSWVPGTGPAAPGSPTVACDPTPADPTVCTEVKMVPITVNPANQYADWPSGIPDPATKGPDWIMIGTEGGFMAKPVVVPQQPVGWNLNPTTFNFGTVNQHSLLLGSAERADVVVDFSAYAGKTLILYNDAPAAFPAGVPSYDYFTGVANQMDIGGAPTTLPGYGPNTRTIMQIRVTGTPAAPYDLAGLNAVFAKGDTSGCGTVPPGPCKRGVFEVSQDPIIIPQAEYNSAYNNTFPTSAAGQFIQIAQSAFTFQPIDAAGALKPALTLPLEQKAMHDEMGGVYDTMFGRMAGMLGLTNPLSPVHVLIPYGYASPPTDLVRGSVEGTPVGTMPDGTQIWRIFHNGVDSHTIHTHLFHAQLVNRLGQDGLLLPTDPIELGWKDTFRVNPLEITYLAMRPTVPTPSQVPFDVPDSVRLIDPTLPDGATLIPPAPAGWFDPSGNAIAEIRNHYVNFGWEYVWHCHILAHEEMDMMHSLVFAVPPKPPTLPDPAVAAPGYTVTGPLNNPRVDLSWVDNSQKEVGFTVQRGSNSGFTTGVRSFSVGPNIVAFTDTTVSSNTAYWYRVFAIGETVGDTQTPGFPTMFADSVSATLPVTVGTPSTVAPANPTLLTTAVLAGPQVRLTWRDNAINETAFAVERCIVVDPLLGTCSNFAQIALPGPRGNTGLVTYTDTAVTAGITYAYRVWALRADVYSLLPAGPTNAAVPALPAAPTNFRVAVVKNPTGPSYTATLTWDAVTNPDSFTIQRATNASFTTGLNTVNPGGAFRTLTQTVSRNTTYYWRIRANSNTVGSSGWTNVIPFPIRTGP
jgi:FtsP/CotA-like multicopper oxidase with cupredoxin domain